MSQPYEILAVRYGSRVTSTGESYLNWHVYDEPDTSLRMDYFFWILRAGGRTTLVDCGFHPEVGRRRGRDVLVDPIEALDVLGIGTVDRIVVSHAHYDHIGNLSRLPCEPEIVMTRRELDFWLGPYAQRRQFSHSIEPDEVAELARARADGRITTFDGGHSPAPGLELVEVGGHTPGQLVAVAAVEGGREAVLATDALHFYDELESDRPFFVVADLAAMYAGFDTLAELSAPPHRTLVAGHDADVPHRFPGRLDGTGMDDLVIRIEA